MCVALGATPIAAADVTYGQLAPGAVSYSEVSGVHAELCRQHLFDPSFARMRLPAGYLLVSADAVAKRDKAVASLLERDARLGSYLVGSLCIASVDLLVIDGVRAHPSGPTPIAFWWVRAEEDPGAKRDARMQGRTQWIQLASWYAPGTDRARISVTDPMAEFAEMETKEIEPNQWQVRLVLSNEVVTARVRPNGQRRGPNATQPGFMTVPFSGDSATFFTVFTYFGHHYQDAEGAWQAEGSGVFSHALAIPGEADAFKTRFQNGWQARAGLYRLEEPAAEPFKRKVVSGRPEKISHWYSIKPDCTAEGYPEVRVVTPPTHGTITSEKGEAFPNFPDSNVRKACNKQLVPATLISYESRPGFAGSDSLVVDIVFPGGRARRVTHDLKVWASPPVRISGSNPAYPTAARIRGLEGRVTASAHVDSAGNVTRVVIKESPHELLSEEAIAAIQKWKFKPPREDGEPVPFVGEYEVVFKLTDPIPSAEQSEQSPIELGARQVTAPSGRVYEIVATILMAAGPGLRPNALVVQFRVDSLDDVPQLKLAAEEIYPLYTAEAERFGLDTIGVQATKFVAGLPGNPFVRYGFVWKREADGNWRFYVSPSERPKNDDA